MDARTYLTITSIITILFAISFLLIPGNVILLYGGPPEAHVTLNLQFCGAALLAVGVIDWFARDFGDWHAMRGVIVGTAIGDVVLIILAVYAGVAHLFNGLIWATALLVCLLLLWALYCLAAGARKPA
jgi:hypothetical protein